MMIDKSGEQRTIKELVEAREAIKKEIIRSLNPIMIYYPIIIEALNELIERRKRD